MILIIHPRGTMEWLSAGPMADVRHEVLRQWDLVLGDVAAMGQTCRQMRAEVGTFLDKQVAFSLFPDLAEWYIYRKTDAQALYCFRFARDLLHERWRAGLSESTPLGRALIDGVQLIGRCGIPLVYVEWRHLAIEPRHYNHHIILALPAIDCANGWDYDNGLAVKTLFAPADITRPVIVRRLPGITGWTTRRRPYLWYLVEFIATDAPVVGHKGIYRIVVHADLRGLVRDHPHVVRMASAAAFTSAIMDNPDMTGGLYAYTRWKDLPASTFKSLDFGHENKVFI